MSLSLRLSSPDLIGEVVFPYGEHLAVDLDFEPGSSLTKQYFRDECDVNVLMARYLETGVLDGRDPASARYFDCTELQSIDYQSAMNFVIEAQSLFGTLPASVRARFGNDPAQVLAFVDDPSNLDECIRLGLLPDLRVPAPTVPLGTSAPVPGASSPPV